MGRPLEAGIGLTLATLIAGCTTTAAEHTPTNPPTLVPTAIPHVRVEPTATPPPPSEPGRTPVFPTPEPGPLSEIASLNAELTTPTIKSIGGLSYEEFMKQRGYGVLMRPLVPRQDGIVIGPEGSATKTLPASDAQTLPKEYSLKAGNWLTSIGYVVLVVKVGPTKKGEPKYQSWITRRATVVLGEGNPATQMWVYNQLEFVDENNTVVTFIRLTNPRSTTRA